MSRILVKKSVNQMDVIDDVDETYVDVNESSGMKSDYIECVDKKQNMSKHMVSSKLSHICEQCHRLFYFSEDDTFEEYICPYCGYSSTLKDDNYSDIKSMLNDSVMLKLEEKINKSSSQDGNGEKEQLSLDPTSDEYKHYIETIKENSPLKPDDEFHQMMEQYNEDLVTQSYENTSELNDESSDENDFSKKQPLLNETMKRAIHTDAVRTVIREAGKTETLEDDILARVITTENPVLYDRTVSVDDYDDALADYVLEITK